MKICFDLPDDLFVRDGVLVISGMKDDGKDCWYAYAYKDGPHKTSKYTQSDLCRRAHLGIEEALRMERLR